MRACAAGSTAWSRCRNGSSAAATSPARSPTSSPPPAPPSPTSTSSTRKRPPNPSPPTPSAPPWPPDRPPGSPAGQATLGRGGRPLLDGGGQVVRRCGLQQGLGLGRREGG